MSKQAVLLIAHGSPDKVEDIPAFLQNISRGRPMSDVVVKEVQHRYAQIGVSPLTCLTMGQANGVTQELGIPAYIGMRNWHPYIADTLKQMTADGIEQAVAICLAPHNSRTSVGLYKQVLFGAGRAIRNRFRGRMARSSIADRGFCRSPAHRIESGLRAAWIALPVIFTAHSVPQRTIAEGDPYEAQTRETAALVAAKVPEIGAVAVRLSEPGHVGGRVAWSHSGGHHHRPELSGPNRRVYPADRFRVRSRGDSLRYRYTVSRIRRSAWHEALSRGVAERFAIVRKRCLPIWRRRAWRP